MRRNNIVVMPMSRPASLGQAERRRQVGLRAGKIATPSVSGAPERGDREQPDHGP